MNISTAAELSGLSAKTIRYYEDIGLIAVPKRASNGYRNYDQLALQELNFLSHARDVGFDLAECRSLLDLMRDPQRKSKHAKHLVLQKHSQLQHRIEQLQLMQEVLLAMAERCRGDEGPECAIIEELAFRSAADE